MEYAQAVTRRPPKPGKMPAKQIRSVEIEKAENGGHVVTHRFEHSGDGPYHEAETHVFGAGDGGKLLAHLTKHLRVKVEAPDKEVENETEA